jgi:hypothetical protein
MRMQRQPYMEEDEGDMMVENVDLEDAKGKLSQWL